MYAHGRGVPKDLTKAMEWLLEAAKQGKADAQHSIGLLYYSGHGVPQDYGKAMEWFLEAAKQGNPNAQYNIGVLHYYGKGVPQDDTMAMEWFLRSANQGFAFSQTQIGISIQFFFLKYLKRVFVFKVLCMNMGWQWITKRQWSITKWLLIKVSLWQPVI